MSKSPLEAVKAQFGSKADLADKLIPLLEKPEGESDAGFRRRIAATSNAKLLKLWRTAATFKSKFGSDKEKLALAILKLEQPTAKKTDEDFKARLLERSVGYLLDRHAALSAKGS